MAKGNSTLKGPLYATGKGLGSADVGGPTGGKSTPDPIGFNKTKGGKK